MDEAGVACKKMFRFVIFVVCNFTIGCIRVELVHPMLAKDRDYMSTKEGIPKSLIGIDFVVLIK